MPPQMIPARRTPIHNTPSRMLSTNIKITRILQTNTIHDGCKSSVLHQIPSGFGGFDVATTVHSNLDESVVVEILCNPIKTGQADASDDHQNSIASRSNNER